LLGNIEYQRGGKTFPLFIFQQGRGYGPIWQKGIAESQESDARTQARHFKKRSFRQESNKPKASDCDWAIRGPARWRQGTAQEVKKEIMILPLIVETY
jgi:hypothetical protein